MKKRLLSVLMIFVLLLSVTGCAAARMDRRLGAAEDRVEEKIDAVEDAVELTVRKAAAPAPADPGPAVTEPAPQDAEPAAVPAQPAAAPARAAASVTKETAEQTALDYVGLTRDQVSRLRAEYDIDDGIAQYDVEFISGDWEYEFEIHAETGKILSFDKDHKYD